MNGKFFKWLGVAAVLGVGALAVAALVLVPPRVNVVMGEPEAARGPDPVSAVAADVAGLREDLRALAGGLENGFGGVADVLDGLATDDAKRAVEVRELTSRVEDLQRELVAVRTELAASRVELSNAIAALPPVAGSAPSGGKTAVRPVDGASANPDVASNSTSPAEPAPQQPPPSAADTEAATASASKPEPEPAAPVAAPQESGSKKKGFLSFKLPSDAFAFDQRTRFAVVPTLSRVGFDAKSTLHDFSGVTSRIEGELVACLARPADGASGRITVESRSLDTGLADRDEVMREHLDVAKFPTLVFEWTAFEAESVDAAAQKLRGTAKGKLSIHGVAKDVAMKVDVAVDASKRITIQGQTKLDMKAFGIEPPSQLGLISVEKDVNVWIALVARPVGRADEVKAGESADAQ
ncbi:MAG: YceI family protein [Planctomycetes bacterium]|nr:YceI family protein [Planctomycetota bacterium]